MHAIHDTHMFLVGLIKCKKFTYRTHIWDLAFHDKPFLQYTHFTIIAPICLAKCKQEFPTKYPLEKDKKYSLSIHNISNNFLCMSMTHWGQSNTKFCRTSTRKSKMYRILEGTRKGSFSWFWNDQRRNLRCVLSKRSGQMVKHQASWYSDKSCLVPSLSLICTISLNHIMPFKTHRDSWWAQPSETHYTLGSTLHWYFRLTIVLYFRPNLISYLLRSICTQIIL